MAHQAERRNIPTAPGAYLSAGGFLFPLALIHFAGHTVEPDLQTNLNLALPFTASALSCKTAGIH
jgi:hypothetical protein